MVTIANSYLIINGDKYFFLYLFKYGKIYKYLLIIHVVVSASNFYMKKKNKKICIKDEK